MIFIFVSRLVLNSIPHPDLKPKLPNKAVVAQNLHLNLHLNLHPKNLLALKQQEARIHHPIPERKVTKSLPPSLHPRTLVKAEKIRRSLPHKLPPRSHPHPSMCESTPKTIFNMNSIPSRPSVRSQSNPKRLRNKEKTPRSRLMRRPKRYVVYIGNQNQKKVKLKLKMK